MVPIPSMVTSMTSPGCIQTGGGAACADRSLLDFFTVTTDLSGIPNIIYTGGDLANGVQLYFTKR